MQGCWSDSRGAGCTLSFSLPTVGCCIQEEEDDAQTFMHAQHTYTHNTAENELGRGRGHCHEHTSRNRHCRRSRHWHARTRHVPTTYDAFRRRH
jgi:hypothetical protein